MRFGEILLETSFTVTCGTAWTCTGGFFINIISRELEISAAGTLTQSIPVVSGGYYMFCFTVRDSLTNQFTVKINTDTVTVVGIGNGNYCAFIRYTGVAGTVNFEIATTAFASLFYLHSFSLIELTLTKAEVFDCNDVYVASIFTTDFREGVFLAGEPGKARVKVDWNLLAIADGCYQICLYDLSEAQTELVVAGDFTTACGVDWACTQAVVGWTLGGGVANFNGIPMAPATKATIHDSLVTPMIATTCYVLKYTIANAVEHDPGLFTIVIKIDSVNIDVQPIATANGNHIVELPLGTAGSVILVESNDSSSFDLTDLSIKESNQCNIKFCSECYDLADHSTCESTVMGIQSTNDNNLLMSDGVYIDWEHAAWSDFDFVMMIKGHLQQSEYPYPSEEIYKFSDGDKSTEYVDSEIMLQLLIERIPPYMHDSIRLLLVHDTVFVFDIHNPILGQRISKEPGSYSPDTSEKTSKLWPVIVDCTRFNQRDINKLC